MADTALPDFRWSAFYYPEIREALRRLKSRTLPEHTESDEHDLVVNLHDVAGLLSHLQASRLDHAMLERFLPTAHLRSSLVSLAAALGYDLARAVPAEVDLLLDVKASLLAGDTLVRSRARFGTKRTAAPVVFEHDDDAAVLLTRDIGSFVVLAEDGAVLADKTAALPGTVWGSPAQVGDLLVIGHPDAMFTGFVATYTGTYSEVTARIEYRENLRALAPDSVAVLGSAITFVINEAVGGGTPCPGLEVTITCTKTGLSETVLTTWDDPEIKAVTGPLGQSVLSTDPADYLVEAAWVEVPDLELELDASAKTISALWSLPQGENRRWGKSHSGGLFGYAAGYEVRVRVVQVGGAPTGLALASVEPHPDVVWTTLVPLRQGQQVVDVLGNADAGSPDQTFALGQGPLMTLTRVTVDGDEWGRQRNLLSAAAFDRAFVLRELPDQSLQVEFGDGTNGAIPSSNAEVVATYRIGGAEDGNVGPDSIVRDLTGLGNVSNPRNPRFAVGWVPLEASTPAGRRDMKYRVPAWVRTNDRAVSPEDFENLAVAFRSADGSQVAARAIAIEEGAGPKTTKVVAVGPGGEVATASDLEELEVYFNGVPAGLQRAGGKVMGNHRAVVEAHTPLPIAGEMTLTVLEDYAPLAEASALAALDALLRPLARRVELSDDGLSYNEVQQFQWQLGGEVSLSVIAARVGTRVRGLIDTEITLPAANVVLVNNELPDPSGVWVIHVVSVAA